MIGGMTCASCAARIEKRLNKLDGVTATVNYATEQAKVARRRRASTVDDLVAQVEAAGYTARAARPAVDERAGRDRPTADVDETRPLRDRLIVSALLSVPVVVLAMIPALQFDVLAVAVADARRAGRRRGARGRSTGPPGSTCATPPPRWTR